MSHIMGNGSKKPITFTLRVLTNLERNYFQIEKKGIKCYICS